MVAILKSEVPTYNPEGLAFRAPTKDLQRALATLARIAPRRATPPILQNVLVRVDQDGAMLAATDLNTSLTFRPGWLGTRGGMCTNAKTLADTMKQLTGAGVSIEKRDLALHVRCGSADTSLVALPDRDFPRIPTAGDDIVFHDVDAATLSDMISRVLFSVCLDETRFHLCGVFLEGLSGDSVRMVSTDGHRLTMTERRLMPIPAHAVIIPLKAAREIAKLFTKGRCTVGIDARNSRLFVRQDGWELCTKLIDARFPPYRQLIPADQTKIVTVERKPMIAALKRALKLASETRGVRLDVANGNLKLTCDHPELGTSSETLDATSLWVENGGEITIGFNVKYLIEALTEIDCEHVTFAFGGELDPAVIRSTEDATSLAVGSSSYVAVVMPMRL